MPLTKSPRPTLIFHPHAYLFVTDALSEAQTVLGRDQKREAGGHVSARELLDGVKSLAQRRFGMMAGSVFRHWGISCTADFGRIVFEMIDRGEMNKTDNDQFDDFVNVYSFDEVFSVNYPIDISKAFKS